MTLRLSAFHTMKKIFLYLYLIISTLSTETYAQVGMGNWRTHLAYNNATQIAQSDNKVYAVSEGALYSVDKFDGGLEFYSKLSGLNGTDITCIKFDKENNQLLIIYKNGNIDLMGNGGVINIPDLYYKQMSASKEVNNVYFYQNKAYLSCNFGIVVLNLQKKEVADTYFIGPNGSEIKVLATTIYKDSIYALSPTALFKAFINEPFLVNYQFWSQVNELSGTGDFKHMDVFSENLILLRDKKLYKKDNENWSAFMPESSIVNFSVSNNSLTVFDTSAAYIYNNQFQFEKITDLGSLLSAEYDNAEQTYWFAANERGILSYKKTQNSAPVIKYFKPVGPAVNRPWSFEFSRNKLFVVPGGRWADKDERPGIVMMYENGQWTNISTESITDFTKHDVWDFLNVAVDPTDNKHFFVTSYGTGLYEFRDNKIFKWHNHLEPNTTIETVAPEDPFHYTRLDGAVYDNSGNLWFNNMFAPGGEVKILHADGTWSQLFFNGFRPTNGDILISNQNPNQKWINSVRYTPGLLVFDDKGTIKDPKDDESVFYYPFVFLETNELGQTVLITESPEEIYSIAQDKNGTIWVGTNTGPYIFNNLSKVFDPTYTCSKIKISREDGTNEADYLLKDEKIKAIAIDGANRKWLGTETSGVYLMSENGQQTIQHFTVSNSPLLSNDILSIAISPLTGEVFFGTAQGIVSYQSDAGEAGDTFKNVYAYPNPVREGYNGIITITGLVKDTYVKITDLTGNLVCETISNGSIATWDGKDIHGRKVSTGIYLAICANADGTQSTITKIMVIN